ncbi:MAG TPA: hypothetical protein VI564_03785 [Candidatus Nanoarchaeia archaeon]|nr:hypothetical protein [Candidatus Nanoarchaeia archaeon]
MATFLDVTGLQYFSSIFVFIFVWLTVFAILSYTHVFGSNKMIIVLVGFVLAIFVIMSDFATGVVAGVAPFLAVLFVLIMLVSVATGMLGAHSGGEAFPALKTLLIIGVVIAIAIGVGVQVRENVKESDNPSDLSQTINLVMHPKFMGAVLLFAVAIFTVALLAGGKMGGAGGH